VKGRASEERFLAILAGIEVLPIATTVSISASARSRGAVGHSVFLQGLNSYVGVQYIY
jgi:hypothetical protein